MSIREEAERFLEAWDSGRQEFYIQSSGSTGEPKTICLKREHMIESARKSALFLKPEKGDRILCCIPVNKVGGLMTLVRSRVWNLGLEFAEPDKNPLLKAHLAGIVSLTPYQCSFILKDPISLNHLKKFKKVLIGGSAPDPELEKKLSEIQEPPAIFLSYGMTETYSHIAYRQLNGSKPDTQFRLLPGFQIQTDEDGRLQIQTPYYEEPLQTNDLAIISEENRFIIAGRSDFMINSGGVKLQPEVIEKMIHSHLHPSSRFVISSLDDKVLGQKLVLVTEEPEIFKERDLIFLKSYNAYAVPKQVIGMDEIPFNAGGKPDRMKVREMINSERSL